MTPKKLRILMILAGVCIVLFGTFFWVITPAQNTNLTPVVSLDKGTGTLWGRDLGRETQDFASQIESATGDLNSTTGDLPAIKGNLTILLPGRFYNDGFQQLAQLLKNKYNLTIHYKKIDNIAYYKQIMEGKAQLDGIDLYLAPTDRLAGYAGKPILTTEDIAPYVHPLFGPLEKGGGGKPGDLGTRMLPYAIDPLVTLTPASTTLNYENQLSFQDIANFIAIENKENKVQMPILRGMDKNDIKILEQGNESFPNYFILTYNIINQIYNAGLESDYNILLDTINNPTISKRSYVNFKITFSKLLKKNPNCTTFPDICVIAYNLGEIKFGFLSDISIEQNYFGGSGANITQLTIYNFPATTGDYKVRGRGFVADKNTQNDKAIEAFAKEYMQAGASNSLPLRQDTLSAFNAILNIQKIQKKYELIFKFEPQFSLMLYPTTLQDQFIKNTNFLTMIQTKNPANGIAGFFEPTSRSW